MKILRGGGGLQNQQDGGLLKNWTTSEGGLLKFQASSFNIFLSPPSLVILNELSLTIGHIYVWHYVKTTALQSNASISMCNELTNDTQSSRNRHFIFSIYVNSKSVLASTEEWGGCERLTIYMQSRVPLGPGKFHVVVLVLLIIEIFILLVCFEWFSWVSQFSLHFLPWHFYITLDQGIKSVKIISIYTMFAESSPTVHLRE